MSTILAFYVWLITTLSVQVPATDQSIAPPPPPATSIWTPTAGDGFSNGI